MRRAIRNAVLVGMIVTGAATARAELLAADSVLGTDTLIKDTVTGLTWLRMDLTRGLSFDQVSAELVEGGQFFGFAHASRTQFWDLVHTNIVAPEPGRSSWESEANSFLQGYGTNDPTIAQRTKVVVDLFGGIPVSNSYGVGASLFGYTDCILPNYCLSSWAYGLGYGLSYDGNWSAGRNDDPRNSYDAQPGVSSWLVMSEPPVAAPIPEPSTYALMIAGLASLVLGMRAKRLSPTIADGWLRLLDLGVC